MVKHQESIGMFCCLSMFWVLFLMFGVLSQILQCIVVFDVSMFCCLSMFEVLSFDVFDRIVVDFAMYCIVAIDETVNIVTSEQTPCQSLNILVLSWIMRYGLSTFWVLSFDVLLSFDVFRCFTCFVVVRCFGCCPSMFWVWIDLGCCFHVLSVDCTRFR